MRPPPNLTSFMIVSLSGSLAARCAGVIGKRPGTECRQRPVFCISDVTDAFRSVRGGPSPLGPSPGPTTSQRGTRTWRVSLICYANTLFILFNYRFGCQAEPPAAHGGEKY